MNLKRTNKNALKKDLLIVHFVVFVGKLQKFEVWLLMLYLKVLSKEFRGL